MIGDHDLMVRSRRQRVLVCSAAFLLVALGAYLSRIQFLGYEWLSRSGCAVVILGIWSGLGGIIQERILLSRLRWRRRNAIVQARAALHASDADAAEVAKEIEKIKEAFAQQTAKLAQHLKLSLGVLEFSLVTIGTFLWGFGDILVAQGLAW